MPGFWIPMLLLAIAGPAYFIWNDRRNSNPAFRWKNIAEELHLQFQEPAVLVGHWKERELSWKADLATSTALLACRFESKRPIRLEIGLNAEVERRAGIIVPDKVQLPDNSHSGFEEKYTIRCQPLEIGSALVDHSVRSKFAEFDNAYLVAANGVIQMRFPMLLRAKDLREAMDIAVSLAETMGSI